MAMVCSLFKLIITPEFPIYGLQICADFNTENNNKPQNQPQKIILPAKKWRAGVVNLNFRAMSTFPVPDFTVSPGHWVNKADTQ